MRAYDIIAKKRDGRVLADDEIELMVEGFLSGAIGEAQMAAWLMAVYCRGLSSRETAALTRSMIASGQVVDLSDITGPKVDKHSTGGVGDKLSLVVVPLVAAAGIKVPKMSGGSLGHTGGTLDKLESIPGFRTDLTIDELKRQFSDVGAVMISQSSELVPADKEIYKLRNATATVSSIPLIAASIISKKLAAGADAIVLDVKVGSGAFMKTLVDARELAEMMVELSSAMGRPAKAVLSDMNRPLGMAVGNALEVAEAVAVMNGDGPDDVRELAVFIGKEMMLLAGEAVDGVAASFRLEDLLNSGAALAKFKEIVEAQGGDVRVIEDVNLLPRASKIQDYPAASAGYLSFNNVELLGMAAVELGAGQRQAGDTIDYGAGLVFKKKWGEPVEAGEPLTTLHIGRNADLKNALNFLSRAIKITREPPEPKPLVYEVIG